MCIGCAVVFVALMSASGWADTGDIAKGAIQSRTQDTLILDTSPCASEPTPVKFKAPWKLKALGKRTCERSDKTYEEYEVEQLAAEDKGNDSEPNAKAKENRNPDDKSQPGKKPAPDEKKKDEGNPPREKPNPPGLAK